MVYREDALLKLAPISVQKDQFHSAVFANTANLTRLLKETARDVHIPTVIPRVTPGWHTNSGYLGLASLFLVFLVVFILFVKWKRQPRLPGGNDV